MKYNCAEEFDLNEIYRKLTSCSQPTMVKASEFFEVVEFNLVTFQNAINKIFKYKVATDNLHL